MYKSILPLILFLFLLSQANGSAIAQTKLDRSIRRVKWDSLLRHDHKHFHLDKENTELAPFYDIKESDVPMSPSENDGCGGHFDTAYYLDINHDGREDQFFRSSPVAQVTLVLISFFCRPIMVLALPDLVEVRTAN